ncbi:MAG: DJ-1/PfpI family protein [DPANN group archaeon]|nr:DJ-1/PfpI family protein [DPANN group archaeon]
MRVLMIIAQKGFRDEELFETRTELEKEGIEVDVASITTDNALSMFERNVKPDLAVRYAKIDDYDALVLVGGSGAPVLANHKEVIDLIKAAQEKGKLIAAICVAPAVLAKAGILKGKRATVWSSPANRNFVKVIEDEGAKYSTDKIVHDKNLITAFGPDQSKEFGKAIAAKLKE